MIRINLLKKKKQSKIGTLLQLNRQLRWIAIITITVIGILACTKKRPEQFAQGQGTTALLLKADYNDKVYSLQTKDSLAQANTTRAANVKVSDKVTGINNYNIVSYETNAALMDSVIFRGKPNYQYEIRYRLTEKFLKVFKVGSREDIPFQEQSFSEDLSDGRIAVPMLGYPVLGYFRVEPLKNPGTY